MDENIDAPSYNGCERILTTGQKGEKEDIIKRTRSKRSRLIRSRSSICSSSSSLN
jgi:hypothetical protein